MVPLVPVLIVPVLTEHERVDAMLRSFNGRILDLVIIDNAGRSAWMPTTSRAERVWHLRMPSNLGVAASWNLGIKSTPSAGGWMIVNHDITFGEHAAAEFFFGGSPLRVHVPGGDGDPTPAVSPPSHLGAEGNDND